MRKYIMSCLLLLLASAGVRWRGAGAGSAGSSESDAKAIEAVIRAQLAAFAKDDAGKAFSYASPEIRQMFRTPENFLAMVRTGYPVVYRPAAVDFPRAFGRRRRGDPALVRMADAEGTQWIAIYLMQRQRDGTWLTNCGCRLQRSEGQVTWRRPLAGRLARIGAA